MQLQAFPPSVQEFMELDLMCNLPREPIEMQAIPTGIPVEKIATDAWSIFFKTSMVDSNLLCLPV